MDVVRSAEALASLPAGSLHRPAVAIGNLDGVHRGHQALIASACRVARETGGTPCVLTFSPHPQEVLNPTLTGHRLTTDAEKFELLDRAGIRLVVALPFDTCLSSLSPEVFFESYLVRRLQAASIHVGDDFRFGRDRSGDTSYLRECGRRHGTEVRIIPAVLEDGVRISSSEIRRRLLAGDVARAARLLGRPYRLSGKVVPGDGRGKQLGVPTANVAFAPQKVSPANGVYACRAGTVEPLLPAVTNFGVRPTFQSASGPTLETHLLDFSRSLYGETLHVDFLDRIRDEKRFDGIDALRAQISSDIETARRLV